MRTLQVFVVALVLLAGTTVSATNPAGEKVNNDIATQEIAQLLEEPDFILKKDTKAEVTLMVNEKGELVVLCVNTRNNMVARYIKSRLNYQVLEHSLEVGKKYRLPVVITVVD
jgi:hypothetical protein